MRRYFKIWLIIFKNSYIRDSKISGVIFFDVLISFTDIIMTIIMITVIFQNTNTLAGWSYYQVLFIFCLMKLTGIVSSIIYTRGLRTVASELIRKGDYDFYLLKPASALALVSISKPRIYHLLNLLAIIALSAYSILKSGAEISVVNLVWFVLVLILGQILFFFMTVISVVPTFWFIRLYSLRDVMNRVLQFARYPAGIYSRGLQAVLYTLFPVLAVTYLPASLLYNKPDYRYIIYILLITAAFTLISLKLWKLGERHYGSASS